MDYGQIQAQVRRRCGAAVTVPARTFGICRLVHVLSFFSFFFLFVRMGRFRPCCFFLFLRRLVFGRKKKKKCLTCTRCCGPKPERQERQALSEIISRPSSKQTSRRGILPRKLFAPLLAGDALSEEVAGDGTHVREAAKAMSWHPCSGVPELVPVGVRGWCPGPPRLCVFTPPLWSPFRETNAAQKQRQRACVCAVQSTAAGCGDLSAWLFLLRSPVCT